MAKPLSRAERIVGVAFLAASLWVNGQLVDRLQLFAAIAPTHLEPGTVAPQLKVRTLEGAEHEVEFSDAKEGTILYLLSATCPWCLRNELNIDALATGTKGRFETVGLVRESDADGVRELLRQQPASFPVYVVSSTVQRAYLLSTTPSTIVIDRDGVVLRSWPGAYSGDKLTEVQDYFQVSLPGLKDATRDPEGS